MPEAVAAAHLAAAKAQLAKADAQLAAAELQPLPPPTRAVARGLLLALAVAIVALLFLPALQPLAAGLIPVPWDKLAHFILYATLTVLLYFAIDGVRSWSLVFVVGSIGALDEWHQSTVPGRSADLMDFFVDVVAAVLAVGALALWKSLRRARQTRQERHAQLPVPPMPPIPLGSPTAPIFRPRPASTAHAATASSRRKQ